jgi:hypothetical protein
MISTALVPVYSNMISVVAFGGGAPAMRAGGAF